MKRIILSILAALMVSCAHQLTGNGSEITNGTCIVAAVPADSAMVVAYPSNYTPFFNSAAPETTFTDSHGSFSICLSHGAWNLVIYDRTQANGAFVSLPAGDSTMDTIVLRGVGSISGVVNDTVAGLRYVGIAGSPFSTKIIGKTDSFSLVKIPPCNYSMNIWGPFISTMPGTIGGGKGTTPDMKNIVSNSVMVNVVSDSASIVVINR